MQQLQDLREHAWQYFHTHATQRLTTFNFYLVVATLLATALFATFHKDFSAPGMGVLIGGLLIFTSFTFWKLDQRNRHMIGNAEEALKLIEEKLRLEHMSEKELATLKLFHRDEIEITERKRRRTQKFWRNAYTYSDCFNSNRIQNASAADAKGTSLTHWKRIFEPK
jgi:hypothetical protein